MVIRNILNQWFGTAKKPTAEQFSEMFKSFWHKSEDLIPISKIDNLSNTLGLKSNANHSHPEFENLGSNIPAQMHMQEFSWNGSRSLILDYLPSKIVWVLAFTANGDYPVIAWTRAGKVLTLANEFSPTSAKDITGQYTTILVLYATGDLITGEPFAGYDFDEVPTLGSPNLIDSDRLYQVLQKYAATTPVTTTEAEILATEGKLKLGFYTLLNYKNVHIIPGTNETAIGGIEPLVVLAVSPTQFAKQAYSTLYPQDYIEYDFYNRVCEDNLTPRPGFIIKRKDTTKNLTVPNDWRNVKYRRFKAKGLYHHLATANNGGAGVNNYAATILYGSVPSLATNYAEYYIQFPPGNSLAAPTLTLTQGANTVTKPLLTEAGAPLPLNYFMINHWWSGSYHGLALVHYSAKYNGYVVRDNRIENDFVKDKYISRLATDFTIGNGTRILVDGNDHIDVLTFGTATPGNNVHDIEIEGSNTLNDVVFLAPQTGVGSWNVKFPHNTTNCTFTGYVAEFQAHRYFSNIIVSGSIDDSAMHTGFNDSIIGAVNRFNLSLSTQMNDFAAYNSFFGIGGAFFTNFVDGMMKTCTLRSNNVGSTVQNNRFGVLSSCIINMYSGWRDNVLVGCSISNKYWEPAAVWAGVIYNKKTITPETFFTPLTSQTIINPVYHLPGTSAAGDVPVTQADGTVAYENLEEALLNTKAVGINNIHPGVPDGNTSIINVLSMLWRMIDESKDQNAKYIINSNQIKVENLAGLQTFNLGTIKGNKMGPKSELWFFYDLEWAATANNKLIQVEVGGVPVLIRNQTTSQSMWGMGHIKNMNSLTSQMGPGATGNLQVGPNTVASSAVFFPYAIDFNGDVDVILKINLATASPTEHATVKALRFFIID